ncbi:hypothetical protein [Rhizorhabdus wittichii]|nr:hypothetical protein [Rhizorhabdus wittichii]
MSNLQRIAALKKKRDASLQRPGGPPLAGYEKRVAAIDEELARLEAENG